MDMTFGIDRELFNLEAGPFKTFVRAEEWSELSAQLRQKHTVFEFEADAVEFNFKDLWFGEFEKTVWSGARQRDGEVAVETYSNVDLNGFIEEGKKHFSLDLRFLKSVLLELQVDILKSEGNAEES